MSTNVQLLLIGLLILLINIIFSALRLGRGHIRARFFGVLLTLAACAVITVGLVRMAFPVLAGDGLPGVAGLAAPGAADSSAQAATPGGNAPGTLPAPLMTAMAAGRIPAPVMTQIAQGTLPSRGQGGGNGGGNGGTDGSGGGGNRPTGGTPGATAVGGTGGTGGSGGGNGGGNSGNGGGNAGGGNRGGNTNNGGNAGNGNSNAAGAANAFPVNQLLIAVLVGGALVIVVSGFVLYRRERQRDTFEPSWSPGLLYTGAGIFILVAALVIPGLPGQFSVARASGTGRFAVSPTGPLPTRVAQQTSTPTATPAPSASATALPSLTSAPSTSPTPLFTAIAYVSTDTSASTTATCTLTAQTILNLRGDPSVRQQAIGKVFAGALLSATGRTADKKWWRVISTNDVSPVEGWVSTDFITVVSGCTDENVPLVGPTLTPSRTPRPSRTPVPSRTPRPSVTPRQTVTSVAALATSEPSATSSPLATSVPASATSAPSVTSAPASATSAPSATNNPSATSVPASATSAPASANTAAVTTCTVMTTVAISLRPDPSRIHASLAQIPEGTALTATGKTADGSWWRVTYPAADGDKVGWIGNAGVFPASTCASLPAVTVTPTP